MIVTIFYTPFVILALFSKSICRLIGQTEENIDRAYPYIVITLVGFYFNMLYFVISSIGNSLKKFEVGMKCMLLSVPVHLISVYIFMFLLPWGIYGAAIAATIHLSSRFFICILLFKFDSQLNDILNRPWDSRCFEDLTDQFVFCLKGMPSITLPWWAADVFLLMATYCGKENLAAQTILRTICLLTFMFPVGIQQTTIIYVGN